MSRDEVFDPEAGAHSNSEKKSGCGWKFVLLLLVITGAVSFLCCIGLSIGFYSMVPKIKEDSAVAKQTLDEIMTIELPESLTPKTAFSMNMFSFLKARGAVLTGHGESSLLAIASLKGSLATDANMQQEIEKIIKDQTSGEEMTVIDSEIREFEINGQTVPFTFIKGEIRNSAEVELNDDAVDAPVDSGEESEPAAAEPPAPPLENNAAEEAASEEPATESDDMTEQTEEAAAAGTQTFRQVRAMIPATQGVVLFWLFMEEENWNEEEIVKMIESIQLP